jgi:hypothetical protein
MKTKVAIISVYLGKLPNYFNFTKKTIFHNKEYDWYIFSDQISETYKENNITYVPTSLDDINNRLSNKLNCDIKIKNPYKLVDTKPTWFDIFEEYIKNYDWWGWSDLDILYGNFNTFLNDTVFENYDIISIMNKFLFGPFVLMSNKHKELYKEIENISNLIESENSNNIMKVHYVDELYLPNIIKQKKFKIFDHVVRNKHKITLIRYGKTKNGNFATWVNGNIEIDSYKKDYWESYVSSYGCDSLLYHFDINQVTISENDKGEIILHHQ